MTTQALYKYRSLENWKLALEIVVNKRLYAAPFHALNDPMEGRYFYFYFGEAVTRSFRRAVLNNKRLRSKMKHVK